MKDIQNFINERGPAPATYTGKITNVAKVEKTLSKDDLRVMCTIVDALRGDLKHNLEQIRKNEDLDSLYDRISAIYKNIK